MSRALAPALLAGAFLAVPLSATASDRRIVSAASVSLREAPGAAGRQVSRLALGTLVEELSRTGGVETIGGATAPWLRVSTAEGVEGWVFGGLTLPYTDADRDAIALAIAEDRLRRQGDPFGAFDELRSFLVRAAAAARAPEAKARLSLSALRALERAAEAIPFRRLSDPAVLAWVEAHRKDLVYSEPGGRWLVVSDRYCELLERCASLPVAEEVAWTAARATLPGECEGELPCSLGILAGTDGRYLERFPRGAHAEEALSNVAVFLDGVAEDPHRQYSGERVPQADRPQVRAHLDRLKKALAPIDDPRARAAAAAIDTLLARYR